MRYQSIEDYIATLSESEKEQYKYLIEECRQRDTEIRKNFDAMGENLGALFKSLGAGVKAVDALGMQVRQLKRNVLSVQLKYAEVVFFLNQCDRDLLQHYPKSLN